MTHKVFCTIKGRVYWLSDQTIDALMMDQAATGQSFVMLKDGEAEHIDPERIAPEGGNPR